MAEHPKIQGLGGVAVLVLIIIGVMSLVFAITSNSTGHPEAAAISLLASVVAFAAIANVIFRT
jgi:hypothetical protein